MIGPAHPGPPHLEPEVPPGYQVLRVLARTEMSMVYLAKETDGVGRSVALKVLNPVLGDDEDFRHRFRREVSLASRLEHPNVIPVYRPGVDGPCFIAMRYVDGRDLGKLLRKEGRLELRTAAALLKQVAAALDAAHAIGLVHRDVKPGNILLDERFGSHVYLLDFGIAKQISAETFTRTGNFLGTPAYASPEQIDGEAVTGRSDIYALGCVLYQCLTGSPPFTRTTIPAILNAHREEAPPRVTDRREDLPAAVDALVAKAMAKEPDERYDTCAELSTELDRIATERSAAPPWPAPPAPPGQPTIPTDGQGPPGPEVSPADGLAESPRRSKRRYLVGAAAGLLGLCAVAAVGWGAWRTDEPSSQALARLPAAFSEQCEPIEAEGGFTGAQDNLLCRDRTGHPVRFGLFESQTELATTYRAALRTTEVDRGSGDCTITTGAEHRYPGVGDPAGRVLCSSGQGRTTLVWTDHSTRTIGRTSVPGADDADLIRSWTEWLKIPDFPAAPERRLLDLVEPAECRRAPAGGLDGFFAVTAAIECESTDEGARTISYYLFSDLDGLRRTYNSHLTQAEAPHNLYCGDGDAPGFLGSDGWVRKGDLELGGLLCHPGDQGEFVVEWSVEPLLMLGTAVGGDAAELAGWWEEEAGPPSAAVFEVINERADPPFPTSEEEALLAHMPTDSQKLCIRPPKDKTEDLVPSSSVTGVVCGPAGGADDIYYYQFADRESMNANYQEFADGETADCLDTPPDFSGSAEYELDGEVVGRLACGTYSDGDHYISWTDERLNIQVFALDAEDPAELLKWWRDESGPIR